MLLTYRLLVTMVIKQASIRHTVRTSKALPSTWWTTANRNIRLFIFHCTKYTSITDVSPGLCICYDLSVNTVFYKYLSSFFWLLNVSNSNKTDCCGVIHSTLPVKYAPDNRFLWLRSHFIIQVTVTNVCTSNTLDDTLPFQSIHI